MNLPIDQVIIIQRQQAVAIAQQLLPIILQQMLGPTVAELVHRDEALAGDEPPLMPPPPMMVEYALQLGQEFVKQATDMVQQPAPGLTGTT